MTEEVARLVCVNTFLFHVKSGKKLNKDKQNIINKKRYVTHIIRIVYVLHGFVNFSDELK